jgi:hypothetical protein
MDDEELFGPVFHRLTFGQAIDQGLLSNYRVVIVGIDDPTLAAAVRDRHLVRPDGTDDVTDAATLARLVVVARAMSKFDLHRVLTFHNRVDRARKFAQRLPAICEWVGQDAPLALGADYVSGRMSAGQRSIALQRLRQASADAPYVLANARCLAEGVDVPNLDGVVFVEPRSSQIDIVQAVGRAIRSAPNKTVGTIVLPLLVQDDPTSELALADSDFATIWQVLRALRAHDETLAEEFDEIRRELGRTGERPTLPDRIELHVPSTIDASAFDSLTLRVVEGASASWDFHYGLLQAFVAREGHASPAKTYEENGRRLGAWLMLQRTLGLAGQLPPARRALLEAIPGWVWDMRRSSWQRNFTALVAYVAEHGHANPPQSTVYQGLKLGQWVLQQRKAYSRKALDPSAVTALSDLQGWKWVGVADSLPEYLLALSAYREANGHLRVPALHREGDLPLGAWFAMRRRFFAQGSLNPRVREALDAQFPGWSDDIDPRVGAGQRPTKVWFEKFELLKRFVEVHGTVLVGQSEKFEGVSLGPWVHGQRRAYELGGLHEKKVELLAALDGWTWTPRDDMWRAALDALCEYYARTGRLKPPQGRDAEDQTIRRWVHKQRAAYAAGTLKEWKIAMLEARLPAWTWSGERTRKKHLTGPGAARADYPAPATADVPGGVDLSNRRGD